MDGNAKPVIRERVRPAVAAHFPAMTTVYLSFRAEGQGSWERLSFPGIVGGGYACTPGSGEMPGTGGRMACFRRKTHPRVGFARISCTEYGCLGRISGTHHPGRRENVQNKQKLSRISEKLVQDQNLRRFHG
jgi:hypothetical protein